MERYDCILIHTPKFNHYFHPIGKVGYVNILPLGLFSMARFLSDNGFSIRIFHMGIEKLKNSSLDIKSHFSFNKALIYGISLQWNQQSYDAIELARDIKEKNPESFIVLGGITATLFKEEILENFKFIDGIISGEGEIPLLKLVNTIKNKTFDFGSVPNLSYRTGNSIHHNAFATKSEDTINILSSNLEFLNNFNEYKKIHFFTKYESRRLNSMINLLSFWISPVFYIMAGKGCPYNCSFCAGRYHLKNFFKRNKPILKNTDTVLTDIENFVRYGIEKITSAYYYDAEENYFIGLINEIAQYFPDVKVNFDVWGLPTENLLEQFKKLKRGSTILSLIYSPLEEIREKNNLRKFSNEELFNTIKICKKDDIKIKFIFLSGLPFETDKSIEEAVKIISQIKKIKRDLISFSIPNELAPFSPMYLNPDKYGIKIKLKTFMDYYSAHSKPIFTIGYDPIGGTERDILIRQCNNMCFLGSKRICKVLHTLIK